MDTKKAGGLTNAGGNEPGHPFWGNQYTDGLHSGDMKGGETKVEHDDVVVHHDTGFDKGQRISKKDLSEMTRDTVTHLKSAGLTPSPKNIKWHFKNEWGINVNVSKRGA